MLCVTMNEIPGFKVVRVFGEVMGITVRSANFGQNFTAGFRSLGGGEMTEYTQVMYESRNEVMNRMFYEAQQRGANAIIAMRFDTDAIGQFTEICAYGTAVYVEPVGDGASAPAAPQQPVQQPPLPPQPYRG